MKTFIATLSTSVALVATYLSAAAVTDPLVVVDDNGNKVAVWQQVDSTNNNQTIVANNYVAGTGWGTATVLSNKSISSTGPLIAVDSNGNCTIVWLANTSPHSLYGAQFTTTSTLSSVTSSQISASTLTVQSYALTQMLDDETTIAEVIYTAAPSTGIYAAYAATGNGSSWTSEGQISGSVSEPTLNVTNKAPAKKALPTKQRK